jgi:phosphoglycerol transferase MdoB-like AlkP superfamily enzyme
VPTRVLFTSYLSILTLFAFWRSVFLLFFRADLSLSHWALYLQSFLVGIRLDLVATSYLMIPILLTIFLPYIGWSSSIYRKIHAIYFVLVLIFITLFCSIDLEWFNEFGNHINTMLIMYGTGGTEGWKLIWEEYNVFLYALSWMLTVYTSFKLFIILTKKFDGPNSTLLWGSLNFLFCLIISVLCMRGGTQEKPVDWGYAHFSKDNMANQIAQNCIFFFGRSYIEMREEENFTKNFGKKNNLSEIENTVSQLKAENNKSNYNINLNTDKRPNIILIILESFISENCNYLNPNLQERITPFIDKLSTEGISFTRCFANGTRSAYGIGSILCSWPVLPGKPIITQVETGFKNSPATKSLRIFKSLGYDLTFLYGGDANFDNMKGFAMANGFDQVLDWNDGFLANKNDGTMWGRFDHIMFDKLLDVADEKGDTPFMINFFTTTNHDPFRVPKSYESRIPQFETGKEKYIRAKRTMAYDDIVLSEFFEDAKLHDWYDNTIFIITADHGLNVHRNIPNHPLNGHIPFIIYSPMIDSPIASDKIVSQIDILPTLLDLMNEDHNLPQLYGNSALKGGDGFACRISHKNLQWITPNHTYYEFMGSDKHQLFTYPSIWDDIYTELPPSDPRFNILQTQSQHYIQHAYYQFKRMY